jgi:hypothetical protein
MHSIPQLVADIQAVAFSPRGNTEFIQVVMGGGVPAIIHALPHLQALSEPSDDEVEVLRKTCEQIIAAQWGWPYEGRDGTSLTLAAEILPTLPARPVPEAPAAPAPIQPTPAPAD